MLGVIPPNEREQEFPRWIKEQVSWLCDHSGDIIHLYTAGL